MKNVFAYVRVSTVRQGQQGVSLIEQRDAMLQYATRHQLHISEWFEEQETAAKGGRRVFNRMLEAVRERPVAGVIIHKVDRSARNLADWVKVGELLDRGIDVYFAHEGLDLRTRGGRLAADIEAVVAADYSRNLSEETKKGFYGRLKQGCYPRPAPVGYADCGPGIPKALDPGTAPLLREAFELYASGRYSVRTLADEMRRRGLRKKSGKALRLGEMAHTLRNPFYIGVIRIQRTGETFDGKHPPLISSQIFNRVQALLDGRSIRPARMHTFTFQRRLRCGACRRLLVGERQKGHVYYRCHRYGCRASVREEVVDDAWRALLDRLEFTTSERQEIQHALSAELADSSQRTEEVRKSLALRRDHIDVRMQRATDALIDGLLERSDFEQRKMTLVMERREIEDQLNEFANGHDGLAEFNEMFELANRASLLYETANLEERQALIDAVSSNLEIHEKTPVFALVPFFQAIAERPKVQSGAPSRGSVRTPPTSRFARSKRKWREFVRGLIVAVNANPIPEYFNRPQSLAA